MKSYNLSKYLFFQERKDGIIILNLYTKYVFALEKEQYNLLMQYRDKLIFLKKYNIELFESMYKLGVIQDNEKDIPAEILAKNRKVVYSESCFRLIINTTLNCNFSCWYCYESHTKEKMQEKTKKAINNFINKIIETKKIQTLWVDWFGGEPLLAFSNVLKPLSKHIVKKCKENDIEYISSITTNGSLINERTIDFFKQNNVKIFQITLDGNKKLHDKVRFTNNGKGTYDIIVKKIILLLNSSVSLKLTLRINYIKESFHSIKDIIESFPKDLRARISIRLMRVWQDREDPLETFVDEDNLYDLFKKEGYQTRQNFRLSQHNLYSCYADLFNQAVINYDGRIFKCTTGDFDKIKEDGVLNENGDIIWNNNAEYKRVEKATFQNEICMKCEILPNCTGGCSQHPVMSEQKYRDNCPFKPYYLKQINKIMSVFELANTDLTNIRELEELL